MARSRNPAGVAVSQDPITRSTSSIEMYRGSSDKQRVMGLCLGYEDLNDHDELCRDRLMALVCESDDVLGERRHRSRTEARRWRARAR